MKSERLYNKMTLLHITNKPPNGLIVINCTQILMRLDPLEVLVTHNFMIAP